MRKLFVFGDSYSEKWSKSSPYTKWKGYIPKNFAEIVSEKCEMELINCARGGFSNYDIFETICNQSHNIGSDDVVIVGWSILTRYRMAHPKFNQWIQFQQSNWQTNKEANLIMYGFSESTHNEILYNRTHLELYRKEILSWINLLKCTFKTNTFINWGWSRKLDWGLKSMDYEIITDETNGKLIDWHWSERGQSDFSEWILKKIEEGGFVNDLI